MQAVFFNFPKKGKLRRLKGRKFVCNPGESGERPQGSACCVQMTLDFLVSKSFLQ